MKKTLAGRVVEWINTAKKIPELINRLKEAFREITEKVKTGVASIKTNVRSAVSDGVGYVVCISFFLCFLCLALNVIY